MMLPYRRFPDLLTLLFAAAGLAAGIILVLTSTQGGTQFRGAILASACALFFGMPGRTGSDDVIKAAVIAALLWGIVGFLIGDCIAWQLAFPTLNFDLPWTNFGHLRPLHPTVMIFAFCGNALLASSFYALQRTCGASLYGRFAPWFVFIGYNAFIIMAGTGYILGITAGREYAEVGWYSNLWLALVWIVYLAVFLGTIWHRKEPHIHVANWFFAVFLVTGTMLHIVNNVMMLASLLETKGHVAFPGAQRWWYDHNGADFLAAGFLGTMYYFMPVRTARAVYSNKLAIAQCLALCLIYIRFIWLDSYHLHYTAYPDWVNDAGTVFSFSLWLLFLAGLINGLTPLAGAWSKLRSDPVVRFLALAIVIMVVNTAWHYTDWVFAHRLVANSLQIYTDWTIGHQHPATAGWGVLMTFGTVYCLVPWLWKRRELYSTALVEWHFWISALGILLYTGAMWFSSMVQRLMWQAHDDLGYLQYSFIETVEAIHPYFIIRAIGGTLFTLGALTMVYNLWMTVAAQAVEAENAGTAAAETHDAR